MRPMDVDVRIHIFAASALGRGRKTPVLILQEAEWIPGPEGHGVQKNFHLLDTRDRPRAVQVILVTIKAENYKPSVLISSGAPCALASLFTPVQHCLEVLVHYLVTLSYKPVQYRLHS